MPKAIEGDKGAGEVLTAAALTSKPHLKQRGKPIVYIPAQEDGKLGKVDLPLIRMGIYRHPVVGQLVFDQAFFDTVIRNHNQAVSDNPVHLDHRHRDEYGTLAFMDIEDGGVLEQRGKWLHSVAPIVDLEAEEFIKKAAAGRWRYTSPEIHLNYKSNQVVKLSTEDLTELSEELTMPKLLKFGSTEVKLVEANGVVSLEKEDALDAVAEQFTKLTGDLDKEKANVQKLTEELGKAQKSIEDLNIKLSKLEKPDPDADPLEGLPAAAREIIVKLQAQNASLQAAQEAAKREQRAQKVAFALEKATEYRDEKGYGHSPVLLQIAEAGLMLSEYKNGSDTEVIKLEAAKQNDPDAIIAYYSDLFVKLLSTYPGVVKMTQESREDDVRPGNNNRRELSRKDIDESKARYHERFGQ